MENLCAICQEPITTEFFCDSCAASYAELITSDPVPAWLYEAWETERKRRNSEVVERKHADDPTPGQLLQRTESDDYQAFIESLKGDSEVDLDPATLVGYLAASHFLNELTPEQRATFSIQERVAVDIDLMYVTKDEYGDELGPLPRKPKHKDKARVYNDFLLAKGLIRRPVTSKQFSKIVKKAHAKLRGMLKR